MNTIIESFLKTHIKEYSLDDVKQEAAFEHFVNRCIINKYTAERFDPDDIKTDPGEKGIDGVAIVVNNRLVFCDDDVDSIQREDKLLNVKFVFIQSKTSDCFSGSEIGDFIYGVKAFFAPQEERPNTNEKMEKMISIKDHLYDMSVYFESAPLVELFYVCCGKWNDDNGLWNRINLDLKPISNDPSFSEVKFYPYDAEKIIVSYKELKKKISRSFFMEKRFTFPPIKGVTQAFIGTIKCKDFVTLLIDNDGNMLTNIFEDNVRDFQGYNCVNKEIQDTINSREDQDRFSLLNNGITIVAKTVKVTGDTVNLFDYQIVNGCQTSYVLYDNRCSLTENSYIVVKLIEVNNEKISDRVIYTTNRQTEVKSEAFTSINSFHKKLQDFYNAIESSYRLYYERRSKQYDLNDDVAKNRIVTLATQVKSYIAIFLNEPHSTHRYYGELLRAYNHRLFLEADSPDLYYISSYLVFYVEDAIKRGRIDKNYKIYKFHIACAMKVLAVGEQVIFGQGRKQKKQFSIIFELIKNNMEMVKLFNCAISCLNQAIADCETVSKEERHRSKEITKRLLEIVNKVSKAQKETIFLNIGNTVPCVVTSFNTSFVYVNIMTQDSRQYGHIHISKINGRYINNLADVVSVGDRFDAKIIEDFSEEYGWGLSLIG